MKCGLAQPLFGPRIDLFAQVALEAYGLLDMKLLEVLVPGVGLESIERLCHTIKRGFTVPFSLPSDRQSIGA